MRGEKQSESPAVRTTLAIDDDVLAAARGLAARQKRSLGEVVSELARRALTPPSATSSIRNGIPLLSKGGTVVTADLVAQLRDELP
jgi:hypothetical protein